MILLYSEHITSRLQYTCSFIFGELMRNEFALTTNIAAYHSHDGVRINYSAVSFSHEELRIGNSGLLFEKNIRLQPVECGTRKEYKFLFKTVEGDLPFDILSATFYLISRYEEYLPHTKDMYGRYGHGNSIAFKEGFLQMPLVNIWTKAFAEAIQNKFPSFTMRSSVFRFQPTYDIDIAYAYKNKSLAKTAGGFLRSPFFERIRVLAGLTKDPFDVYSWLDKLHRQYNLHPAYFFLVSKKNSRYDKNILPHTNALKQLVATHAQQYDIGLHPGWKSGDKDELLVEEKQTLEKMSGRMITRSRQHYIRFNLPEGYRRLIDAGITDDYSMGYGTVNGFRASVASSFLWYDLQKEAVTSIRVHPFCFMDANSFYEQHFNAEEAYEELVRYYDACKEANGTLCTIWHNNFLGSGKAFAGWRECYERFIALLFR